MSRVMFVYICLVLAKHPYQSIYYTLIVYALMGGGGGLYFGRVFYKNEANT